MKSAILLTGLTVLAGTNLHADTVIEFRNQGDRSQFLTNGKMARINTRGSDEYMLVNFDNNSIYSIAPADKEIINISEALPSISGIEARPIRLKLRPLGKGPTIAGYPTVQFRLVADGEHCGSIYASREALRGTAVESMFDTLKTMADSHRRSLGAFASLLPVCQMARFELASRIREIGAPMRITDKEGNTDTEITRILKNARVEDEHYAFPPYYQQASAAKTIQSAQTRSRQTDSTPARRPDTYRMKREMQKSRYLPPEALNPMRRYYARVPYAR